MGSALLDVKEAGSLTNSGRTERRPQPHQPSVRQPLLQKPEAGSSNASGPLHLNISVTLPAGRDTPSSSPATRSDDPSTRS